MSWPITRRRHVALGGRPGDVRREAELGEGARCCRRRVSPRSDPAISAPYTRLGQPLLRAPLRLGDRLEPCVRHRRSPSCRCPGSVVGPVALSATLVPGSGRRPGWGSPRDLVEAPGRRCQPSERPRRRPARPRTPSSRPPAWSPRRAGARGPSGMRRSALRTCRATTRSTSAKRSWEWASRAGSVRISCIRSRSSGSSASA